MILEQLYSGTGKGGGMQMGSRFGRKIALAVAAFALMLLISATLVILNAMPNSPFSANVPQAQASSSQVSFGGESWWTRTKKNNWDCTPGGPCTMFAYDGSSQVLGELASNQIAYYRPALFIDAAAILPYKDTISIGTCSEGGGYSCIKFMPEDERDGYSFDIIGFNIGSGSSQTEQGLCGELHDVNEYYGYSGYKDYGGEECPPDSIMLLLSSDNFQNNHHYPVKGTACDNYNGDFYIHGLNECTTWTDRGNDGYYASLSTMQSHYLSWKQIDDYYQYGWDLLNARLNEGSGQATPTIGDMVLQRTFEGGIGDVKPNSGYYGGEYGDKWINEHGELTTPIFPLSYFETYTLENMSWGTDETDMSDIMYNNSAFVDADWEASRYYLRSPCEDSTDTSSAYLFGARGGIRPDSATSGADEYASNFVCRNSMDGTGVTTRPFALISANGRGNGVGANLRKWLPELAIGGCKSANDNNGSVTNYSCLRFGDYLFDVVGYNFKYSVAGTCQVDRDYELNPLSAAFYNTGFEVQDENKTCPENTIMIAMSKFSYGRVNPGNAYGSGSNYASSALRTRMDSLWTDASTKKLWNLNDNPTLEKFTVVRNKMICTMIDTIKSNRENQCMTTNASDVNNATFFPPSEAEVKYLKGSSPYALEPLYAALPTLAPQNVPVVVTGEEIDSPGSYDIAMSGGVGNLDYMAYIEPESTANCSEVYAHGFKWYRWRFRFDRAGTCVIRYGKPGDPALGYADQWLYKTITTGKLTYNPQGASYTGVAPDTAPNPQDTIDEYWVVSKIDVPYPGNLSKIKLRGVDGLTSGTNPQEQPFRRAGYTYKQYCQNQSQVPVTTCATVKNSGQYYVPGVDIIKNTTFYPMWNPVETSIIFNNSGNGVLPSSLACTFGQSVTLPAVSSPQNNYTFQGWSYTSAGTLTADGSTNQHTDLLDSATTNTCANDLAAPTTFDTASSKTLYAVWSKSAQSSLKFQNVDAQWQYYQYSYAQSASQFGDYMGFVYATINGGSGTGNYTAASSATPGICEVHSLSTGTLPAVIQYGVGDNWFGASPVTSNNTSISAFIFPKATGTCTVRATRAGSGVFADKTDDLNLTVYKIDWKKQTFTGTAPDNAVTVVGTEPSPIYYINEIKVAMPNLTATDDPDSTPIIWKRAGYKVAQSWVENIGTNKFRDGISTYLNQINVSGDTAITIDNRSVDFYPVWNSLALSFSDDSNGSGLTGGSAMSTVCYYGADLIKASSVLDDLRYRPVSSARPSENGYVWTGYSLNSSSFTAGSGHSSQSVLAEDGATDTCYNTNPATLAENPGSPTSLYRVYAAAAPPPPSGVSWSSVFNTSALARITWGFPTVYEGNALSALDVAVCYSDTPEGMLDEDTCTIYADLSPSVTQPYEENIASHEGKYFRASVRAKNAIGISDWTRSSTSQLLFPQHTVYFNTATGFPADATLTQNVAPSNYSGVTWNTRIGDIAAVPPAQSPAATAYEFLGWRSGISSASVYTATNSGTLSNCSGTALDDDDVIRADTTYYPCWAKRGNYTVTWNSGTLPSGASTTFVSGGTNSAPYNASISAVDTGKDAAAMNALLLGASFLSWHTADSCGGDEVTFPYLVSADVTFYGCYQQESDITITYDMNFTSTGGYDSLIREQDSVIRFSVTDTDYLATPITGASGETTTITKTFPYNTTAGTVYDALAKSAIGYTSSYLTLRQVENLVDGGFKGDCRAIFSSDSIGTITENKTVYPCWAAVDGAQVKFDKNGITTFAFPANYELQNNEQVPVPSTIPQAVGYSFDHWGTYSEPAEQATACSAPEQDYTAHFGVDRVGYDYSIDEVNLVACWTTQPNVTITLNPGTLYYVDSPYAFNEPTTPKTLSIPYNSTLSSPLDYAYQFSAQGTASMRYTTEDLCQGTYHWLIRYTANTSLYGCYTLDPSSGGELDLHWNANLPSTPAPSGAVADMPTSTTMYFNSQVNSGSEPTVSPTLPGYEFAGWKNSAGANGAGAGGAFDFTIYQNALGMEDVYIYASWTLNSSISVTFKPNSLDGDVTNLPANLTGLSFGNALNISAMNVPARPGYAFEGWDTCEVVSEINDNLCTTTTTTTTYSDPDFKVPSTSLVLYPKWRALEVNVSYVNNDATAMAAVLGAGNPTLPQNYTISVAGVSFGDILGAPVANSHPGYTFAGWYLDATCSGLTSTGCTTPATGSLLSYFIANTLSEGDTISIYPKFTRNTYAVKWITGINYTWEPSNTYFYAQSMSIPEGAGAPEVLVAAQRSALTALEQEFVAGHHFLGWQVHDYDGSDNFQSQNATKRFFNSCDALSADVQAALTAQSLTCTSTYTMPAGNIELEAHWVSKDFTNTYYLNYASHPLNPSSQSVTFDTSVSTPSPANRSGWTFEGWYECATPVDAGAGDFTCTDAAMTAGEPSGPVPSFQPARNMKLFAKWTQKQFKVRFYDNDRTITGTGTPPLGGWDDAVAGDVLHPTEYLQALVVPGFTFLGWATSSSCSNLATPNSCTATLLPQDGILAVLGDIGASGSEYSLYAAWEYRSLTTSVTVTSGYTASDSGQICLQGYRGSVAGGNEVGGQVCSDKAQTGSQVIQVPNLHKGDIITITATEGGSEKLQNLSYGGTSGTLNMGNCTTDGNAPSPCVAQFTVGTNNHSLQAAFVATNRTLTITSTLGGQVVASTTTFNDGDLINLRAMPSPGYSFAAWNVTGDLNTTYQNGGTSIHGTSENGQVGDVINGVDVYGDGNATVSATFAALPQNVNFWDMNGTGTPIHTLTCATDATCTMAEPTLNALDLTGQKPGYTFAGYYVGNPASFAAAHPTNNFCVAAWTSAPSECTDTSFTTPSENVQLYARWIPYTGISVAFDLNYPSAPAAPATLTGLTFDTLMSGFPANPTRAGYDFLDWRTCTVVVTPGEQCLEVNKGVHYDATSTAPMANAKLYAFWHRKNIKVRFAPAPVIATEMATTGVTTANPGGVVAAMPGNAVANPVGYGWDNAHVGDTLTLSVPANHSGWTFTGYYTCASAPTGANLSLDADCSAYSGAIPDTAADGDVITLWANFTRNTYTIWYGNNYGDAGSFTDLHPQTCTYWEQCEIDEDNVTGYQGYTFAGWRVNSPENLLELHVNEVFAKDCTAVVASGTPKTCFEQYPPMPNQDVYLIADRMPIKYNITFNKNVESAYESIDAVTGIPSNFTGANQVATGQTLPAAITSATPQRQVDGVQAYDFVGFKQSQNGTNCTNVFETPISAASTMPPSNMLLCAIWQIKTVAVSFYDGDGALLQTSTNNRFREPIFPANRPANPSKTGYTFAAWNTGTGGSGTDYALNQNISASVIASGLSLYPRFEAASQSVTFNLGSCPSATPTWVEDEKTATALADESHTWQALSSEVSCIGSEFTGYDISAPGYAINGTHIGAGDTFTGNMPATGYSATATWIARTYSITAQSQFVESSSYQGVPREVSDPGTVTMTVGVDEFGPDVQVAQDFELGDTYSLKAEAAPGFTFTRWRIVVDETQCDPGITRPSNTAYFGTVTANPSAALSAIACDLTIQAEFTSTDLTLDYNANDTTFTSGIGNAHQAVEVEVFTNSVAGTNLPGASFSQNFYALDTVNVLLSANDGFLIKSAQIVGQTSGSVLSSCDNDVLGQECDFENDDPLEFSGVSESVRLEVVWDRISYSLTVKVNPDQYDATNGAYFGEVQIGDASHVYGALAPAWENVTKKAFDVFSINAESNSSANFERWRAFSQGSSFASNTLCQGTNWEEIEACVCEMPNFDVSLEATFAPNHYYLHLEYEDQTYGDVGQDDVGGQVSATITSDWKVGYAAGTIFSTPGTSVQADIYAGKLYDVVATPDEGFYFDHWISNRVDQPGVEICTEISAEYIANGVCPAGSEMLTGLVKQPQNTVLKAAFKRSTQSGTLENTGAFDGSDLWETLPEGVPDPEVVPVVDQGAPAVVPAGVPITFTSYAGVQMQAIAPVLPGYTFTGFEGAYTRAGAPQSVVFSNASYAQGVEVSEIAQSAQFGANADAFTQPGASANAEFETSSLTPLDEPLENPQENPTAQAGSIPGAYTAQFTMPAADAAVQIRAVYAPIARHFTATVHSTTGSDATLAGTLSVEPDYTTCLPAACTPAIKSAKQYFAGLTLDISASVNTGWTFDHINVTSLANGERTEVANPSMMLTANTNYTIEAYFKPDAFTLDVETSLDAEDNPHGQVRVVKVVGGLEINVSPGESVEHGTTLRLQADSNSYNEHRFSSWESDTGHLGAVGQATSPYTTFTMPMANSHLRALFAPVLPTIRILEAPQAGSSACDTPQLRDITDIYVGEHLCVRGQDFFSSEEGAEPGTPDPYPINIELHSDPITLGMTMVNQYGEFALPVRVSSAEEAAALQLALDTQHEVVAYSDSFNEDLESSGFDNAFEAAQSVSAAAKVNVLLRSGVRPGPGGPGAGSGDAGTGAGGALGDVVLCIGASGANPEECARNGGVWGPSNTYGICSDTTYTDKANCEHFGEIWTSYTGISGQALLWLLLALATCFAGGVALERKDRRKMRG